jgi:hypothetical protein
MATIHLTLLTTLPLPDALSLKAIPFQAGKLHRAEPPRKGTSFTQQDFNVPRDFASMYKFMSADLQRMYDEMCRGDTEWDDERTHAKSSNFEKDSAFTYEDFMRSWGQMYR